MSSLSQRKTVIRRSLTMLEQVTQGDNLRDLASLMEAQRQFQTLCDEISSQEQPTLVLLAALGNRIASDLFKGNELHGEGLQQMVRDIAEHLVKDMNRQLDSNRGVKSKNYLTLNPVEVTLALKDGHRLGELLVTLKMLTQPEVDETIKIQRATGQRLGEVLLQSRLLTPEMLESALEMQKKRRATMKCTDPWSPHYTGK